MKIAIMSDVHDHWKNLQNAIKIANRSGCKHILFAGDLVTPTGVGILEKFKGTVKFVWGNNEGEKMGITRQIDASKTIELCGYEYEGVLGNTKIFINHYPRIAELAAKSEEFDLCIYGHNHKYNKRRIKKCILLNPGKIQSFNGSASFVIFNTSTKQVEKIILN
jgi:putative phosphoesterase